MKRREFISPVPPVLYSKSERKFTVIFPYVEDPKAYHHSVFSGLSAERLKFSQLRIEVETDPWGNVDMEAASAEARYMLSALKGPAKGAA